MRKFTSKRTYTIVFFSVLFLLSISFYSNKDFYKKYIIDKIYSTIDFQIVFKDSSLTVFPSPGIILNQVTIHSLEGENKIEAELNFMEFFFSWKILFGEIELNNVQFKEGKIELTHTNKLPAKESELKTIDTENIKKIFTYLNLDTIEFHSVQFIYKRENLFQNEIFINSLFIRHDHINTLSIGFDVNYEAGNFKSLTKIEYIRNDYSFNSLEIESQWKISNFALKPFKEYYSLVDGAAFDNTSVNGNLTILKEKFKNEFNVKTEIDIINLYFKGAPVYPTISASSELTYLPESKKIEFHSINVFYENGAIANANGTLTFANDVILNLNIRGEYADIYKVIYLIVRSVDIKITSNINFYSHMNIYCARAIFDFYELKKIKLDLDINNTTIGLKVSNADVLEGHISGKGSLVASQNSSYNFDVSLRTINSEAFIAKYTKNPYLKGTLNSNLNFTSSGNSLKVFLDNLQSNGKVEIKKGELLGYANIIKPIFSLGKLINFLGPRGKNTEFQSLTLDYAIQNKNIKVQNLKMIGVGLDAHGGGTVNFERKIDFRIYVGLGGLAGKAFYIPIIYKGIIPDNVSYIDPIWIGSVYVSATLLGGPAGATVGGLTGSAVSEYVNKAWEGIKGIFSREVKEE